MLERLERPLPVGWEEQRHLFIEDKQRQRLRLSELGERTTLAPRALRIRCNGRNMLD